MPYLFQCDTCSKKCDGKSLGEYHFLNDVQYSEHFENAIISDINAAGFYAKKTTREGYPDIEVYESENGPLKCYIEVKAQRRTFMSVAKLLPQANLLPSETLALNLSDLERYFAISKEVTVPVYVLWVVSNRPCIVPDGEHHYFFQKSTVLEKIYNHYGESRRFRRKSGNGDVVNGQHLGVVVNYHFSLDELMPFNVNNL